MFTVSFSVIIRYFNLSPRVLSKRRFSLKQHYTAQWAKSMAILIPSTAAPHHRRANQQHLVFIATFVTVGTVMACHARPLLKTFARLSHSFFSTPCLDLSSKPVSVRSWFPFLSVSYRIAIAADKRHCRWRRSGFVRGWDRPLRKEEACRWEQPSPDDHRTQTQAHFISLAGRFSMKRQRRKELLADRQYRWPWPE